nr:alkaline ceramidase [Asgard group archaeon]
MSYKIGIGMYDCTGPAAEQTMFGYSYPEQRTAGIADRQWARAFVIQDEKNNFLCLTVVDVCIIFQSLKDEVLKRLTKRIGKIFNSKNTMISAIHNHSGPAGYSDYPMFISSDKGFCKLTFNAIVNGCVHAITRAFHNMKPAKILFTTSELVDCGGQRSKEAWESNPQKEKERYGETDKSIVLLKFIDSTDKLFGILVFYALHAVSLGVKNNLISADNRGYAA